MLLSKGVWKKTKQDNKDNARNFMETKLNRRKQKKMGSDINNLLDARAKRFHLWNWSSSYIGMLNYVTKCFREKTGPSEELANRKEAWISRDQARDPSLHEIIWPGSKKENQVHENRDKNFATESVSDSLLFTSYLGREGGA